MTLSKITKNNFQEKIKNMNPTNAIYVTAAQLNTVIDEVNGMTDGYLYDGVIDCSASPNYPAMTQDHFLRVSVAGLIGGGSGLAVEVGDEILCIATSVAGDHATVGANFMIVQKNMIPTTVAVLRTGTNNSDFVTAKTLADDGLTFSATTPLGISGGSSEQLKLTTAAGTMAMVIDANVTAHTAGYIVSGLLTVNSASVDFYHNTISVSTALSGGELVKGTYSVLTNAAADADTSGLLGEDISLVSTALGQSDLIGYRVIHSGTASGAAGTPDLIGFNCVPITTVNSASTNFYGVNVDLSGMTLTSIADIYGVKIVTKTGVDAGLQISGNVTTAIAIANAATTGISLTGVCTTGIEISGDGVTAFSVTSGFSGTTGLLFNGTATNGISITGACTQGISVTGASTTGVAVSGGTTQQLLLTATAAQRGITITQTAGTESAIYVMSGINSTTANVVDIEVYPSAALTGTEMVTGVYADMDSNGADADGTSYSGFRTRVVATTAGRGDMIGYTAAVVGSRTTADTDQALLVGFGNGVTAYTQNNASSQSYGLRIAALTAANYYVQTDGQFYGIHLNATSTYTQSATCTRTGLYLGGNFDRGIDFKNITLKAGQENAMIDIGTWTTAITVSSQTEHYAPIQVNLSSNTNVAKNITAARFRVDTAAANTLTAVYGIQVRNNLQHNVASAYGCHASMNLGTMAVITGAIAVGSFYLEGTGTITPAGANPIDVVNATNVHSGTGVSNVLNVCNNTASAVGTVATLSNLAGTVTNMLYLNNANTAGNTILIAAGTVTNVLSITGASTATAFISFDAATASTCFAPNTSAINALTAKAAIKVTQGANTYWIPCFSCTDGTGGTFN